MFIKHPDHWLVEKNCDIMNENLEDVDRDEVKLVLSSPGVVKTEQEKVNDHSPEVSFEPKITLTAID